MFDMVQAYFSGDPVTIATTFFNYFAGTSFAASIISALVKKECQYKWVAFALKVVDWLAVNVKNAANAQQPMVVPPAPPIPPYTSNSVGNPGV